MAAQRRSLRLPIILGVVMIVIVVVLIVAWVIINVVGALSDDSSAGVYWAVLSIGTTFLVVILVGVSIYLGLTVKAINLNRRQSNFIDSVTHELRSPIASIKLYLQTLSRHQVSPEEHADFCRFMLADITRLERLVNHVLDAARLEHGDVARGSEDVDIAALVVECAEIVSQRYRAGKDVIRLDLEPCAVRADRHDLELVFRNLIDNAVKYAGDPPRVEVTLRRQPPASIVFQVSDNGRGIPAALRRKVFGRFVRLGLELERTKPGTGLGLYIVRTIVHQLRGEVRVRDNDAGAGTMFEVELPQAPPGPELTVGADAPARNSTTNESSHDVGAPLGDARR
jgi:signal transduction histidine kinase